MPTVQTFGVHLLIDGYGGSPDALASHETLAKLLRSLPDKLFMHAICEPVVVEVGSNNRKDPGGISGFVMIAESHISVHTFPKRGFVSIDVYTCQDELNTEAIIETCKETFKLTDIDTTCLKRGVRYPSLNVYE
jgi:S-adenosylmethionine decarboxylase